MLTNFILFLIAVHFSVLATAEEPYEPFWLKAYSVISLIDGNRCRFSPTCSVFTSQALAKHGSLLGSLMAFDRLQRTHDANFYDLRFEAGHVVLKDPLENHEFWNSSDRKNLEKSSEIIPTTLTRKDTPDLNFASYLIQQGEYELASIELHRFLYSRNSGEIFRSAQDNRIAQDKAHYWLGICAMRLHQWDKALRYFSELTSSENISIREKAYFKLAHVAYLQRSYNTAAERFYDFRKNFPESQLYDASATFEMLSHVQRGEILRYAQNDGIVQDDKNTQDDREKRSFVPSALRMTELRAHFSRNGLAVTIPQKSPYLAGFLSGILPGAGQFYNGRPWDALVSFSVNSLLMLGTAKSFYDRNYVVGGLLGFLGVGFYAGNIFSGIDGAYQFNQQARRRFAAPIENRLMISLKELGLD